MTKLSEMIRMGLSSVTPTPGLCLGTGNYGEYTGRPFCGCVVGAAIMGAVEASGQEFDYQKLVGHPDFYCVSNANTLESAQKAYGQAITDLADLLQTRKGADAPKLLAALPPGVAHFRIRDPLLEVLQDVFDREFLTAEQITDLLAQDGL